MNRKYFVTGLVFLVTAAGFAQGVQMTYEHDEAKMKQITVMESGIGAITRCTRIIVRVQHRKTKHFFVLWQELTCITKRIWQKV